MIYREDVEQEWDAAILAAQEDYQPAARAAHAKGLTVEGPWENYVRTVSAMQAPFATRARSAEYAMHPLPWSPSGLDDFVNCPKAYCEKKVKKTIKEERTEQQIWGEWVHEQFENYVSFDNFELDKILHEHLPFLDKLKSRPGHFFCEIKAGLDRKGQPCSWEISKKEIWFRGKIDYLNVQEAIRAAIIVDYKTGRPHDKFRQLMIYAIHTFLLFDFVDKISCQFYWTKTQAVTKKVYTREEVPLMWATLLPDLKQYKEAFQTDIWQARKSGLCKGWCPVKDCENWEPKRK